MFMVNIKKQIPNSITLGNLTCGLFAIISIFKFELEMAAFLIILAAFLDFFDGFVARLLKVDGALGKQLDSLADMVTFGLAPALILNALVSFEHPYLSYSFVLVALMSAFRLAKFNIDTRQTNSFIGVPTPFNAMLTISWIFIDHPIKDYIFSNEIGFTIYCIVVSYLLVSELKLPALKFKKGQSYFWLLIIFIVTIVSFFFVKWLSIPIAFILYLISPIMEPMIDKKGV